MKVLINRNTLTRLVAMDLLDDSLASESPDEIRHTTSSLLASAMSESAEPDSPHIEWYARLRQVEACYKKARSSDNKIPERLEEDAIKQFLMVEQDNLSFNKNVDDVFVFNDEDLQAAISYCHSFFPPLSEVEDEMWSLCEFGPGATFHGQGRFSSHILSKMEEYSVTPECKGLAFHVLQTHFPRFYETQKVKSLVTVKGNRLAFVPKDEDKCRTIAIEPSLNMFLQKGCGEWMLRRLRSHFGIDLRDQSVNQEYARIGSITGSYSTIDMSDASSRIPRELVRRLLPADWFVLLDTIRSRFGKVHGEWHKYEMFSSQGNAFTFPLETLIFYSICAAVQHRLGLKDRKPIVYGDDMVVDTDAFHAIVSKLEAVGGKVNILKSFSSGPFRESCGADWIHGHSVRPIYYKKDAVRYSEVATLHNLLVEKWGEHRLPLTLEYLRSLVPLNKRLVGPRCKWVARDSEMRNRIGSEYNSYFWVDPTRLRWVFDPNIHDFIADIKVWTTIPIAPDPESYHDITLWNAFLYGGTLSLDSSRLVKHRVRRRFIALSSVLR